MSVILGDCLDVMAGIDPESVDAVVTDPPYDLTNRTVDVMGCEACGRTLGGRDGSPASCPRCNGSLSYQRSRQGKGFMGKAWDGTGVAFQPETWAAALRVAKPSAYLLAFGGTRTVHRMTVAIEDAGWIIRDMLVWAYASGFPKSKASLKPAWEPIVMARKPGPLRMLAIDACRIPIEGERVMRDFSRQNATPGIANPQGDKTISEGVWENTAGRWPANVVLTDPIFDGGWEGVVGGGEAYWQRPTAPSTMTTSHWGGGVPTTRQNHYDTEPGTYSRFFVLPKADRADREPVLGGLPPIEREARYGSVQDGRPHTPEGYVYDRHARRNHHPTVKPTELMRHLVRLVTPTGGVVLDPFLGSGTTAIAAEMEGFAWIGIEKEAEYVAIAEARLNGVQTGLGLPA